MPGHIRKRYDSSWIVTVELGRDPVTGKRRRKQVAVRGSRRDAERVLRQLEAEADAGALPMPGRSVTVAELVQQWLEHVRLYRERGTYDDYRRCSLRIIEALGQLPADKLRPAHIQKFYDSLRASGARRDGRGGPLSPEYIRHHHRALHAALSWGVRMELLPRNPADQVTVPAGQRPEPTVLTHEQLRQLLEAARGTRWYALWYVAAYTGMRNGELLGLHWPDIDWDEPSIRVRRAYKAGRGGSRPRLGDVKSHEARTIYLHSHVVEVLEDHRSRQRIERAMEPRWDHPEIVFHAPGGRYIYPTVPSQALLKLSRRIGLPDISMHDLRHTHGSHLLAAGWDLAAVSERLGHADVAFTARVYAHVIPGIQKRHVERDEGRRHG